MRSDRATAIRRPLLAGMLSAMLSPITSRLSALPPRKHVLLVAMPMCVLLFACWLQNRSATHTRDALRARQSALLQMRADTAAIERLSTAPKRTVDQPRSKEELLATIEQSLIAGDIPLEHWQDTIPQPPQQAPGSPLKRMSTRLYVERVELRDLTAFAVDLVRRDPTLHLSSVHLTAPRGDDQNHWDADLIVSYSVLD